MKDFGINDDNEYNDAPFYNGERISKIKTLLSQDLLKQVIFFFFFLFKCIIIFPKEQIWVMLFLKRQMVQKKNNAEGGRIYLGISDSKEVVGIKLNYKERDQLISSLVGYTNDFYPSVRVDKIKVVFIPIKL